MTIEYGTPISATKIVFGYGQMFQGIGIGAGAALLAALYPSLRAVTIQPIDAMKRIDEGTEDARRKKLMALHSVSCFSSISPYLLFRMGQPNTHLRNSRSNGRNGGRGARGSLCGVGLVRVFKLAMAWRRDQAAPWQRLARENLLHNPQAHRIQCEDPHGRPYSCNHSRFFERELPKLDLGLV